MYIHARPARVGNRADLSSRAHNAIRRALVLKPLVTKLGPVIKGEQYYRVDRSDKISSVPVVLFEDADGQLFIRCYCEAGNPMIDLETQLPAYKERPCFHAAAALIQEAEETNDVS